MRGEESRHTRSTLPSKALKAGTHQTSAHQADAYQADRYQASTHNPGLHHRDVWEPNVQQDAAKDHSAQSSATQAISVHDIQQAQPQALDSYHDVFAASGEALRQEATHARASTQWSHEGTWQGAAADAASARVESSVNRWDTLGISSRSIGLALSAYASLLGITQQAVNAALASARAASMKVATNGQVNAGFAAMLPGVGVAASGLAEALSAVLKGAVKAVELLDTASAAAVRAMSSITQDLPGELGYTRTSLNPGAGFDTTSATSTALSTVPTIAGAGSSHSEELSNHGVSLQRIDTPSGVAFIAGDLDHAEAITTFVSGVGSSTESSMQQTSTWAGMEAERARQQGHTIAVIAWHGYKAPPDIVAGIQKASSQVGGQDLQRFQEELRRRNPQARLRVVGYSYGSVVVGQAAAQSGPGLAADSVLFLGSPGVGTDSASTLRINSQHEVPGARVRSEHAPGDLIQLVTEPWFGVHGPDPSAPHFGTDSSGSTGAGHMDAWAEYYWDRLMDFYLIGRGESNAHSSYLWDPSVSIVDSGGR